MKKLFILTAFLFIISTPLHAFVTQGNTDTSINYRDFRPYNNGYIVTLVNLSSQAKFDFYIIFRGFDSSRSEIYRKRIPIDLLEGNGKSPLYLPNFNEKIIYWKVETQKLEEFDVHVRNP